MMSVEKARDGEVRLQNYLEKNIVGPPSSLLNLPQGPQRVVQDGEGPMSLFGPKSSGPLLPFLFQTKIRPLSS